ncbi:MAG: phosphate ABC transporter substrate-binding protein [Idiomarina sp.]
MSKLLSAFILILLTFQAQAGTSVIVHPSNSFSLTADDVTRLFTGRSKTFPDGRTAVPVNLTEAVAVRAAFDEKVLGRSSSQIKAHWSKLLFTGKGTPPKEVDSDQEVIDLVKSNPNIIGYISSENATGDVKVLLSVD